MLESHWLAYATDGATYAEASVDSAWAHVLFTAALAMKFHFACRQSGSRMKHYMEAELAGMHLVYASTDCNGQATQQLYTHRYFSNALQKPL
ncbi:hypothetical protein TNCV_4390951 [Trichonephila clavipes]|nr:hypothetical protein TNCV_4390951 [Trichonephila clavipes]